MQRSVQPRAPRPVPGAAPVPRLCFISYPALTALARTVLAEFDGPATIEVVDAAFAEAIEAARSREAAGRVDAFLSAGSNAALLRAAVPTPVAEIGIDGFDLLLALREARAIDARVGLLTYGGPIAELEPVKTLLDVDVVQSAYRDPDEVDTCLAAFAADGRRVVVGTSLVVERARKAGLTGVLAYSVGSIRKAINVAIELARVARLDTPARPSRGHLVQFAGRDWIAHRAPLQDPAGGGAMLAFYEAPAIGAADATRTQRARRRAGGARYGFDDLVGDSPALRRARDAARRFAATDLTVLITGETGTGKELFAQAIHRASRRSERPFVAINCSALPESLLESELFGYDDGAFTGSRRGGRAGLFEAAHAGTLFLDEIGDMPVALQTRLLRVLQEREVMRVGGTTAIPVDVRIVAATHQDLPALIEERRFRVDLYYRLNTLRLGLPPLRERAGDVARLAHGLLARALARLGSRITADAIVTRLGPALERHPWPGNVRELENVCERLAVLHASGLDAVDDETLALDCPELFAREDVPIRRAGPSVSSAAEPQSLPALLRRFGGSRARTAAHLGISRATLWRRLARLRADGIAVPAARADAADVEHRPATGRDPGGRDQPATAPRFQETGSSR